MTLEGLRDKEFGKPSVDKEKKDEKTIQKLLEFGENLTLRKIIDASNRSVVYGYFENNNHIETRLIDSLASRTSLKIAYHKDSGEIVSDDYCASVLGIIAGKSLSDNTPRQTIFNRIAMENDCIYYDPTWEDWKIIKIDSKGYKIIDAALDTPLFERKQHQAPPVKPEKVDYDALVKLCDWLRIKQTDRFIFKVHLVSLFLEKYPMPIMVFTGEQGSIKTTITGTVKMIVDPSSQEHLEIPDKPDDMVIQMYNRYLSAFDNITGFDQKISDRFCRVVTGLGVSKRQLYKDMDEIILTMIRKIILNGIAPSLDYPDLRDRCIFYESTPIDEDKRLTVEEFNKEIVKIKPGVIDQIFMILAGAIKEYTKAKNDLKGKMQRMSDFSVWGEAISRTMGIEPMQFIEIYKKRILQDALDVVDTYPIVSLVQGLMKNKTEPYEDSVSNFHHLMKTLASNESIDIKSKYSRFPKAPNKVIQQLMVLRQVFQKLGFVIAVRRYWEKEEKYTKGTHLIKISKTFGEVSSVSSVSSVDGNSRLDSPKFTDDTRSGIVGIIGKTATIPDDTKKLSSVKKDDFRHEKDPADGTDSTDDSFHYSFRKLKKSDYYATPKDLFATICQLNNVNPQTDVCATKENRKCDHFFTEEVNGLKQNWGRDVWCNPPYSNPHPWIQKCYAEHIKNNITVTALIRLDRTTAYWRDFIKNKAEIIELNHRVKFIDPETNKPADNAGRFESVVVIWRGKKS